MEYVINPVQVEETQFVSWTWWDDIFTTEELDILQQRCINASKTAEIGNKKNEPNRDNIRRSKIEWLYYSPEVEWVYAKVSHVIASLNASYYKFNISGFNEPMQLTNYVGDNSGMYTWHIDGGSGSKRVRKLSFSMQLAEPSEYEGGDLQIHEGGYPITLPKKRGMIAVFPSFLLHQVTPVTRGSRQSLVAWSTGSRFI